MTNPWVVILIMVVAAILLVAIIFGSKISKLSKAKKYERGLKMVPLLIHLRAAVGMSETWLMRPSLRPKLCLLFSRLLLLKE